MSNSTPIFGEELFDKYDLNAAQKVAASALDGYIRLTAGAGSGKTKTLATRFIYLTEYLGLPLESVLCITFTRKAADEMRKRIRDMSGSPMEGSRISTYQGLCNTIVKEDIYRLHFNKEYTIIGEDEQEEIIREIYKDLDLKLKDGELSDVKSRIAAYKSQPHLGLIKNYIEEITLKSQNKSYAENVARLSPDKVISHYLARQIQHSELDFTDMLNFVFYLFITHVDVLEKWQDRLQYIMVDEFQDTSSKENIFINMLAGKHHNLFVVGDPDQAIYSFKGGDVEIFLNFNKDHSNAQDLFLSENYRSSHCIVDLSNEMIQKNKNRIDKSSRPVKKNSDNTPFIGQKVTHFHARYDKDEFDYIAKEIETLVKSGYQYKDIAALVRSHKNKKPLEAIFVKENIPYTIADGTKFYARVEIKTAIAYLKMADSDDDTAFLLSINTPKRGIGDAKIKAIIAHSNLNLCSYYESLKNLVSENDIIINNTKAAEYVKMIERIRQMKSTWKCLTETVHNIIRVSGYYNYICEGANEERIINIDTLVESARNLEERAQQVIALSDYIIFVDELSRKAEDDEEKDELKIMSMHSSKGLEFKVVFLPCFNDKTIPSAKSLSSLPKFEEERRLAYVALTRAEELLYITESEGRDSRGINKIPSRFLFDFDRTQINQINPIPESLIAQFKKQYQSDDPNQPVIEILPNGSEFQHPTFGMCTVVRFENDRYYVDCEKKSNLPLNRNLPFLQHELALLQQKPMTVLADDDLGSDTEQTTEDEHEFEAFINKLASHPEKLAVVSDYEANCLGQISNVSYIGDMEALESHIKPPLEMTKTQNTQVQHHTWGIGYIEHEEGDVFLIDFPEINERKKIPKNSLAIRQIN